MPEMNTGFEELAVESSPEKSGSKGSKEATLSPVSPLVDTSLFDGNTLLVKNSVRVNPFVKFVINFAHCCTHLQTAELLLMAQNCCEYSRPTSVSTVIELPTLRPLIA